MASLNRPAVAKKEKAGHSARIFTPLKTIEQVNQGFFALAQNRVIDGRTLPQALLRSGSHVFAADYEDCIGEPVRYGRVTILWPK